MLLLLSLVFSLSGFAQNSLEELEQSFFLAEKSTPDLIPSNYKHIVFYGKDKKPTKIAILYLHGFSASPRESSPLSENIAKALKANLYFPRYAGHGISGTEGLSGVKLEDWQRDTKEALKVARTLGEKVVVVAMSTAAPLAIQELIENSTNIKALVLLSPNFGLPRWDSELLLLPGGAWLAKLIVGPYREWKAKNPAQEIHWTTKYPSTILVEVMRAVQLSRKADYRSLKIPTFSLSCENDTVIDTKKIAPNLAKIERAVNTTLHCTEDSHVFAGEILSPNTTKLAEQNILGFLFHTLK